MDFKKLNLALNEKPTRIIIFNMRSNIWDMIAIFKLNVA